MVVGREKANLKVIFKSPGLSYRENLSTSASEGLEGSLDASKTTESFLSLRSGF